MSWTDHEYNPSKYGGGGRFVERLRAFVNWSFPMGHWWGIDVRVSVWLVLFAVTEVLLAPLFRQLTLRGAITEVIVLFGIVLLHEFGHCFACRWVGGEANEILLWPLGGLAFVKPPEHPWPTFVSVAGGPAVNVVICVLSATFLLFTHQAALTLNPFMPPILAHGAGGVAYIVAWIFIISYILLLLNLLPMYPLDGGQILQTMLWPKMGNFASKNVTCIVGMVVGGLAMLVGLFASGVLLCVGLLGVLYSYQRRTQLKMLAFEGAEEGMDFSESLRPDTPPQHHHLSRRKVLKARRQAARDRAEQECIDAILAKVSSRGLASLSWSERRALHQATARKRKQDAELVREYR